MSGRVGKVTITIGTDNAAFGDNDIVAMHELAHVLRKVIAGFESMGINDRYVADTNGNTCAHVEVERWEET